MLQASAREEDTEEEEVDDATSAMEAETREWTVATKALSPLHFPAPSLPEEGEDGGEDASAESKARPCPRPRSRFILNFAPNSPV